MRGRNAYQCTGEEEKMLKAWKMVMNDCGWIIGEVGG
jgi:hypothetical protein